MKAVLVLTESIPELEAVSPRPSFMLWLADRPIIAHMAVHLLDFQVAEVHLVIPQAAEAAVSAWLASAPDLSQVTVHTVSDWMSPTAALRELGDSLSFTADPLLLASNRAMVMHDDWLGLGQKMPNEALVLGEAAVVIRGDLLAKVAATPAGDLAAAVTECGLDMAQARPFKYFPITTAAELLLTNQRLLGGGFSSPDALERSYTEEFGVIPPVFIHPDAEIYSCMIGPYVSIGAGAVVENTALRNTIIETGAQVNDVVLNGTIIGKDAQVKGTAQSLIVADGETK